MSAVSCEGEMVLICSVPSAGVAVGVRSNHKSRQTGKFKVIGVCGQTAPVSHQELVTATKGQEELLKC